MKTLPGAPHIAYRGDDLCIEDASLEALARRFGTPLYVYSKASMLAALAGYQRALVGRDHLICYALKANSNLAVLQLLAAAGCGFDIVSGGELARVLAVGVAGSRIVFSGVGKTRAEMRQALAADVLCFNVESEAELEVLSDVALAMGRTAAVSLRVNPDVDPKTHPYISTGLKASKFGIAHEQALAAYRRAAALPGLRVTGIDFHIGSQITDASPYLDALDRLLDLADSIEAAGIPLHHIDLGGGLGITYTDEAPPAAEALVTSLLERIDSRGHGHRQILLEPGRSLVGNAGVLLAEVLYLKPGVSPAIVGADTEATSGSSSARSPVAEPKDGSKNFCVVDAAMNDLMRPALYQAWMAIVACRRKSGDDSHDLAAPVWDVVGPVCESGDWLGHDRPLAVSAGDIVAVLSAGAYGMAMASNYNTRPRAAEVIVSGSDAWLVRERETAADLFAGERLLPAG